MKKFLLVLWILLFVPQIASAATVTFLTSGTSFTTPSDWTLTNSIECIGSGGDGRIAGATVGRPGGGGGAYAKVSNLFLSGSISYVVGAGGAQNDTYFNGVASTSASLSCAPGRDATAAVPGAGGSTTNSTGTTKFAGGAGGTGLICSPETGEGGGGGGSGGPGGAGGDGDIGTAGTCGGGFSSPGLEWNYGPGAGCGPGGYIATGGELYGGGGGGGGAENCFYDSAAGSGAQGIIVVTYWPTLSSMVKIWGGKVDIRGGRVRIY